MNVQLTKYPYLFWLTCDAHVQPMEDGTIKIPEIGIFVAKKMPQWRYLLCKYLIPFCMLVCVFNANDFFMNLQKCLQYGCALMLVAVVSLTEGAFRSVLVGIVLLTAFLYSMYSTDIVFLPFALKYSVLLLLFVYFVCDLRVQVFELVGDNGRTHLITHEEFE